MANTNGNFWKMAPFVLTILLLIGGWLVTWGQTSATIDTLTKEVDKNSVARDTTLQLEPRVANIEDDIDEIKENLKDFKTDVVAAIVKLGDKIDDID